MTKNLLCLAVAFASLAASAQSITFNGDNAERTNRETLRVDNNRFIQSVAVNKKTGNRMAAPASRAGEALTMDFGYCGEPYTAFSLNGQSVGDTVWQAIELDEAVANKFAGAQIKSINIANPTDNSGVNPAKNVTVFLTEDLDAKPFYTQDATLGSVGMEYTKVTLNTTYTIEAGKPVYFGYYFTQTAATLAECFYLVIDYMPTDNLSGGWYNCIYQGEYGWDNIAPYYGSLCITATLEGNLPENYVSPVGLHEPISVEVGSTYELVYAIKNEAANLVNNFEIEYTIGSETKTLTVTPDTPVAYNNTYEGSVSDAVCNTVGANIPVSMKVTKINGVANKSADVVVNDVINCLPAGVGFDRAVVLEEGTGTWCGWCVLGIPVMEWVRENYTDGTVIPIAVHSGDEMEADSYVPAINRYFNSFPSLIANRDQYYSLGFYNSINTNKSNIEAVRGLLRAEKSFGKVSVEASYASEAKTALSVTATTEFAMAAAGDFRLAFVVTEDGVGPYYQTNNLSGQSAMNYPGYTQYTKGGKSVSTTYNDVARSITDALGIAGSVPASVEAGKTYTFTREVSLAETKNPENCHLVAMLLNATTGEIENAAEIKLTGLSGIDSVLAGKGENVAVKGGLGTVEFAGDYTSATIYTTAGAVAAKTAGEGSIALPAGIYVVKADSTVAKVVVR